MKLKNYFLVMIATAMFATTNAQETLSYANFPTYHSDPIMVWWPDGWFYGGSPWITNSITTQATKKIQFEAAGASSTKPVGYREVYQYVKLGIGTFEINARCDNQTWTTVTPFGIKVTNRTGAVLGKLPIPAVKNWGTPEDFGPVTFTTTANGTYKYAMYCDSIFAYATCLFKAVSCNQIDGNPYDVGADPYAGINDVKAARCDAYPIGNKIVLSSDEQIETVSVISVNGSIISKVTVKNNNFEMPKPSQRGVYFVKMQTATQNKVVKIQ